MPAKHKLIAAAAVVHLAIALLYAPHIPVELYIPRALDRILSIYGSFSGTRARFDFFAPWVSSEARADFLVVPAQGPSRRVRLVTPSEEASRRLALMYTLFAFPSERERLMQAWGRYVLRLNPDAVSVETRVEMLVIPTMQERAAGKLPAWTEVGRATVRRGGEVGG